MRWSTAHKIYYSTMQQRAKLDGLVKAKIVATMAKVQTWAPSEAVIAALVAVVATPTHVMVLYPANG